MKEGAGKAAWVSQLQSWEIGRSLKSTPGFKEQWGPQRKRLHVVRVITWDTLSVTPLPC